MHGAQIVVYCILAFYFVAMVVIGLVYACKRRRRNAAAAREATAADRPTYPDYPA